MISVFRDTSKYPKGGRSFLPLLLYCGMGIFLPKDSHKPLRYIPNWRLQPFVIQSAKIQGLIPLFQRNKGDPWGYGAQFSGGDGDPSSGGHQIQSGLPGVCQKMDGHLLLGTVGPSAVFVL